MAARCSGVCSRQSVGAFRSRSASMARRHVHRRPVEQQILRQPPLLARESTRTAPVSPRSRSPGPAPPSWRSTERPNSPLRAPPAATRTRRSKLPARSRACGSALLDQPHSFDGLDRPADVVLVACGAREHQRIDDDVFRPEARTFPLASARTAAPPPACARA